MLSSYPDLYVPLVSFVRKEELPPHAVRAAFPREHRNREPLIVSLSKLSLDELPFTGRDLICRQAVLFVQIALYAQRGGWLLPEGSGTFINAHEHYAVYVTPDGHVYYAAHELPTPP